MPFFKKRRSTRRRLQPAGAMLKYLVPAARAGVAGAKFAARNAGRLAAGLGAGRRVRKRLGRKINKVVRQDGTGSSFSTYKTTMRGNKKTYNQLRNGQLQQYTYMYSGVLSATSNAQCVESFFTMYNSDLVELANQIKDNLSTATSVPLKMVNATDLVPQSRVDSVLNTLCYTVKDIDYEIYFSNTTTANVIMDLYECEYRQSQNNDPVTLFRQGLADAYTQGGVTPNTMYITPFQSPTFTANCKVNKVHHIELAQGRSHKHVIKNNVNHYVDMEQVTTNGDVFYRKVTKFTLVIFQGLPGVSNTNATYAVTCPTQIAYTVKYAYKYAYTTQPTKINTLSSTIPAGDGTVFIANEGSGLVQLVDEA